MESLIDITCFDIPFANAYLRALAENIKDPIFQASNECNISKKQGLTLLEKKSVQDYLKIKTGELLESQNITLIKVFNELNNLAFSNIADVCSIECGELRIKDFNELSRNHLASIESIKQDAKGNLTIKQYGKIEALKTLVTLYKEQNTKTDTIINHGNMIVNQGQERLFSNATVQ